jgi:tetratricopeptide (TPR) repeat protein
MKLNEIRAFVGHSFTEADSDVVAKFLKYFDQISNSNPNFSWDHAEAAEPKLLAEKVISLIDGKNLFLGICTRKEYVIDPSQIKNALLSKNHASAPNSAFYFKTSDWIIQEIGLAIGKGLEIVLLLENGVRRPGGLQGDLEYISFDRGSPEKCFGKILEMITALSPRSPGKAAATGDIKPDEEPKAPLSTDQNESWWIPKPGWTRGNYEIGYMLAIDVREADAQAISDAYLATEEAGQGDNRNSWTAFCEFFRLSFAQGGSLQRLKDLAVQHPHSAGVAYYLARAHEMYQDYAAAARIYEAAVKETGEVSERLRLLKAAAVAHGHAGSTSVASAVIKEMKQHFQNQGTGEVELLSALRELANIDKDQERAIVIMERTLSINPSDNDTRFALAFKYSEIENNDLALLHYLKIPLNERVSMAWNNLGVAFNFLGLPAKSIEAYRRAERMGETLAMSNIAEKFITEGFLAEARTECDNALKVENYHNNVITTLARLNRTPGAEDTKQSSILQKARPVSDFYVKVGRAMCRMEPTEIPRYWKGPDCKLEVTMRGSKFVATGAYESQNVLALASAFAGAAAGTVRTRHRIEYSGILMGCVIKAHVTRKTEGQTSAAGLLGSRDNESIAIMMLTDDESEIHVMEPTKGANPRFYTFTREPSGDD